MKTMKRVLLLVGAIFLVTSVIATGASALTFTFSDKDFLSGASWGTMNITVKDSDTLMVRYDAASSLVIPAGSQATGFGFTFVPNTTVPNSITNPANGDFTGDRDDLFWIKLTNINAIPQPANGDEFSPPITKFDFFFGATDGDAQNFSPPGILPGEFDVFFLDFVGAPSFSDPDFNLGDFVDLTGVRIQSLPSDINTGSIFLVGKPGGGGGFETPVPEPSTIALLGSGLIALGLFGRRRIKK